MSPMALLIINLGLVLALAAVMVAMRILNPQHSAQMPYAPHGAILRWKLIAAILVLGVAGVVAATVFLIHGTALGGS